MPVRSLSSSVLRWPNRDEVEAAVRAWYAEIRRDLAAQVVRAGYFGSYARGDWGVGSDVDIILIVASSDLPFERRSVRFDTLRLPVPADLLVYTLRVWEAHRELPAGRRVAAEVVWLSPD